MTGTLSRAFGRSGTAMNLRTSLKYLAFTASTSAFLKFFRLSVYQYQISISVSVSVSVSVSDMRFNFSQL